MNTTIPSVADLLQYLHQMHPKGYVSVEDPNALTAYDSGKVVVDIERPKLEAFADRYSIPSEVRANKHFIPGGQAFYYLLKSTVWRS